MNFLFCDNCTLTYNCKNSYRVCVAFTWFLLMVTYGKIMVEHHNQGIDIDTVNTQNIYPAALL